MKNFRKGLTLDCLFLILLTISSLSYAKISPESVVGVWLLDEGRGEEVKDISKNRNDGKVVGAEWVDGKIGKALEFDGISHVEIPASASTDNYVDGFTYLLWVMPKSTPSNVNVRLIERDWHNPTIQIGPSDFYGSTQIKGDQANSNIRGGKWSMGEWSFVALTWDGSILKLYVDGKMVNEKKLDKPDFTKAHNNGAIWLAQWKGGQGWDFTGVIDEVAVFCAPLDENDLKNIMDNGLDKALGISPVSNSGKITSTWGHIKDH